MISPNIIPIHTHMNQTEGAISLMRKYEMDRSQRVNVSARVTEINSAVRFECCHMALTMDN